jgi:hypothetical protein
MGTSSTIIQVLFSFLSFTNYQRHDNDFYTVTANISYILVAMDIRICLSPIMDHRRLCYVLLSPEITSKSSHYLSATAEPWTGDSKPRHSS